jgi:hypothetical protein
MFEETNVVKIRRNYWKKEGKHSYFEGLSTGAMTLGFFLASYWIYWNYGNNGNNDNGKLQKDMWLYLFYHLHWLASMAYHVLGYHPLHFQWDKIMIHLLITERLLSQNLFMGLFFVGVLLSKMHSKDSNFSNDSNFNFSNFSKINNINTTVVSLFSVFAIWILAWYSSVPLYIHASYILSQMWAFLCLVMSDLLIVLDRKDGSTVFMTGFHLWLGVGSFFETIMIPYSTTTEITEITGIREIWVVLEIVVRYMGIYLVFFQVFRSWLLLSSSEEERENIEELSPSTSFHLFYSDIETEEIYSKICSFLSSSVLSVMGVMECIGYFGNYEYVETVFWQKLRREMVSFYLAYTIVDFYLGIHIYPKNFRWLEGKVHHLSTGMMAFCCLLTRDVEPICKGFICEVSTVLLSGDRLVPFQIWKEWKSKYFSILFVFFRLYLFSLLFILNWKENKVSSYYWIPFSCFILVNYYWWFKMKN